MARKAVGAVKSYIYFVLFDHAPKSTGVGCPDGLAFVEHGRAPVKQGRVHDVGMADHPADVGRSPENVAR